MHAVIVTPAPTGSRLGNRHTAQRWARILRALGIATRIASEWHAGSADCLIALHAKKSLDSLLRFRAIHPDRPLILALTGTDIYRDIHNHPQAAAALDDVDRLIVLQEEALAMLSAEQREKTWVIHQSELARGPWRPSPRHSVFSVIGHLRDEKDPFRAVMALALNKDLIRAQVIQAGQALAPGLAEEAGQWTRREPRYRWVGSLPHSRALALMRRSHALVVSSAMEGGAHVISEAIVHGVPVLASDIPGNRGLLGRDYPGLFPFGDTASLAALMRRIACAADFRATLHQCVLQRQALFTPQREIATWRALLASLSLIEQ
jgi:putative glycosyltransferase (TIGR04348 family)